MIDNFKRDLNAEQELAAYLDRYLYPRVSRLKNVCRIFESVPQFEGVDVAADLDGESISIDEKGFLTVTEPYKTFAFELSYINRYKERRQGWLFDEHKRTTHYLLCWNKRDEGIRIGKVKTEDFHYILAMLISRNKFISYLNDTYGITSKNSQKKVDEILQTNQVGRLETLSEDSYSRYHFSNHIPEQPINIVMTREELLSSGAVEFYYLVKRKELINKLID